MSDYSVSEFVAFLFKDARAANKRLRRIGEQLEAHFPYRVYDSWLSPRGELGLLNLATAAHAGPATGSEPLAEAPRVPPANRSTSKRKSLWVRQSADHPVRGDER